MIQYLTNHGYAVYAINNRGSSGYGKTFFAMDDKKHGEADLGDVVASKEMLAATGWIDPARIGIIGEATEATWSWPRWLSSPRSST